MVSAVQIFFLAIPVIIIVNDIPDANLVVRTLAVFLNDFALLSLIFFPKMALVKATTADEAIELVRAAKEDMSNMISKKVFSKHTADTQVTRGTANTTGESDGKSSEVQKETLP
eukprot:g5798.t1